MDISMVDLTQEQLDAVRASLLQFQDRYTTAEYMSMAHRYISAARDLAARREKVNWQKEGF